MLGLYGLIKKDLAHKGKLPIQYCKNILYQRTTRKGKNYIKLAYSPITETTGTFTSFYSFDGISWTKVSSKSYRVIADDFIIEKIGIYSPAVKIGSPIGSVPVSSIKFIYDDEVLFG